MSRTTIHKLDQSYVIKKIGNRGTREYVIQLQTAITSAKCYVRNRYGAVVFKEFHCMPKDMQALARLCCP